MDIVSWLATSCAPGIVVGIVLAIWNQRQKRRDDVAAKREAEREERRETQERNRQKSELLRVSLLLATAKLSYAVAMAAKRGRPNGEIEEGVKAYNKALEEFRKFEREQMVQKTEM